MIENSKQSAEVELRDAFGRWTKVYIVVACDGAVVVEIDTDYEPDDHMRVWINDCCAFIGKPYDEPDDEEV